MWNSVTRYHPQIGFTMMPNVKSRIASESGGYLVRTNSAGFRSDREFVRSRTPGKFRALVFGDSQTAGDCVSNGQRYSDVVERLVPDLEVYNYGLSGTGTDQHYLTYLDCADDVDHDLVIIGMHVANIGRVASRFARFKDDQGKEVIYAKPYYTVEQAELKLNHVPVPKAPLTKDTISAQDSAHVDWGANLAGLRNIVTKVGMRDLAQKIVRFQPLPDYAEADNANWLLLRKILATWIQGSSTPILLFLIPTWSFTEETSDPTNYRTRYRELADDTGCYLHDPLVDLWRHPPKDRRDFRFKNDPHYTINGHQALAASLAPAIARIMATTRHS